MDTTPMESMELHVWEGENKWGLPSMDLESLQMMAYIKFSGAPVSIMKTSNPFRSPTGTLPMFKCNEGAFTDFNKVAEYLRIKNFSCDHALSGKQCSEVIAYENLVKEKLFPALVYLWWVEPKSYYDIIQKWYFEHIPFPYKFVYPGRYHQNYSKFIECLYDDSDDIQHIETELHKQAQECLTMLSNKLGDKEYFFGKSPSTLDALLFSYLSLLLKINLKVPVLQNHIKACPNLSRYVSKIMQRYFPTESKANSAVRDSSSPDDIPNKGRNLLLSGMVAFVAMFGYAVATGLVQVDMGEAPVDDDEDYSYEYESYDSGGSED